MIENIKIYGERSSGTNWLQAIVSGKSYYYDHSKYTSISFHGEGNPAFNLPVLNEKHFGHKHFFGNWYNQDIKENGDNTLFIGIVRNFYDYSLSLLKHKHHIPEINQDPNIFFKNEWYSIDHEAQSPRYGEEIMEDRNWITGERYKNIFELRKNKIEYLQDVMPQVAKNYVLIRYEDLVDDVDKVVSFVADKFDLKIINNDFTKSIKNQSSPYIFNPHISLINENIDWETENKLGYQPIAPINNIEDFIKYYDVDEDFDSRLYQALYPETDLFYQPYCKNNNISDRTRLFFHYAKHGELLSYHKNVDSIGKSFDLHISKLDKGIEYVWPPHPEFLESYQEKVNLGKSICTNSKIAVVALARQCEKQLQNSIDLINSLVNNDLRWFVYENDSTDNTKEILSNNKSDKFEISLNNLYKGYLTGSSLSRTLALAEYRNICWDWVNKNCSNFDYVIVLDVDADEGFSVDGIYNSIYWLNHINSSGGMGSYSMLIDHLKVSHYDSFAVRLNDWLDSKEQNINISWFRYFNPKVGSDPISFYSCFGGLAVYKTQAFLSSRYDGSIGSEHIGFHKTMKEKGWDMYLNPSSRFMSVFNICY